MTSNNIVTSNEEWGTIIRPQRAWWDLRLGELWRYRGLIGLWMRRDFVATYMQTVLGPVWYLFSPIFGSLLNMLFFNKIARISTGDVPPMLFYLPGMMVWGYFTTCLNGSAAILFANAGLFGKVYFPRLIMPLSTMASALIGLALQAISFIGIAVFFVWQGFDIHLTPWVLALPFYTLLAGFMGVGIGLIFASLTTRYRDLQHFIAPGLTLVNYATPIVYPITFIPDFMRPFVFLNPMVPIVEGYRYSMLGSGAAPNPAQLVYALVFTLVFLTTGVVFFNHAQNNAVDTV
jgi:lipopolysaccharide transport system permease protein